MPVMQASSIISSTFASLNMAIQGTKATDR